MKKALVFIFFLSCSVSTPSDLTKLYQFSNRDILSTEDRIRQAIFKYPLFNVEVFSLPNDITLAEKKWFFEMIDLTRIVLNTPEFKQKVLEFEFTEGRIGADRVSADGSIVIKANSPIDSQLLFDFFTTYPILRPVKVENASFKSLNFWNRYAYTLTSTYSPTFLAEATRLVVANGTQINDATLGRTWEGDLDAKLDSGGWLLFRIAQLSGMYPVNANSPVKDIRTVFLSVVNDPTFREKYAQEFQTISPFTEIIYDQTREWEEE